ncbi:GNAT family N-acetyltransferase [Weissella hellenica]|nr:GNAT family N-acetyltransferase [Weissella hellenica]
MFQYKIDEEVSLVLPRPNIDAKLIYDLIDDSRNELAPWLTWPVSVKNIADEEHALVNDLEHFGKGESLTTIITFKNHPAGIISFNRFHKLDNSTEIGYWLATKFVGKGIMQRAVIGMCELGFNDYHVNKIEIHAAVENIRSNKVAKNAGFHLDGLIRASQLLEDGYHDGYIWTLLKSDWDNA